MAAKQIAFDTDAREKILRGAMALVGLGGSAFVLARRQD